VSRHHAHIHVPRMPDLPQIPIREVPYARVPKPQHDELRGAFHSHVRKEFLIFLAAECRGELVRNGFSEKSIRKMAKGQTPNGFQVHHKLALDCGGTNDFANLVLIDAGTHMTLHRFIVPQMSDLKRGEQRSIHYPMPEGHIYVAPDILERRLEMRPEVPAEDEEQLEDDRGPELARNGWSA
jgi:hypothetical protein